MKLIDYLKETKYKMPEDKKLLVFDNIKNEIRNESIFLRFSFYTKVSVYSLFLLFVFYALFFDETTNISQNITLHKEAIPSVQAGYIGKIIQSTGDFQIYDNDKKLDTNRILRGNTIVLKNGAYLTIAVNKGIKLYVVGPSKVNIDMYKNSDGDDVYVFNMLDGDYISVRSNSVKDKIVIKSKYLNIQSDDKYIDLKYEKKGKAVIVENNGGNILVRNENNVLSLDKKEKLIFLSSKDSGYIKELFSDDYKKYQITDGKLKVILSSNDIKKLGNLLNKRSVIIATGKYVLGKLNGDKKWENEGKEQIKNIILNVYNLLSLDITPLLKSKIEAGTLNTSDLLSLIDNLLEELNKKYIIPKVYVNRLKVMIAYLLILENIKNKRKFKNLTELVNYLNIDKKYKDILLKF